MTNPWNLSKNETRAIDALIEHGTPEKAATSLCKTLESIRASIQRARKKMGVNSTLLAAVKWDRWARTERTVHESNQALLNQVRELEALACQAHDVCVVSV